ncbi:MAG: hypothetical protein HGA96_15075 [Desulfobulbaceae bacterium]|nr:hypothetical protein [Desulfobulbaceae bacterium]
MRTKLVLSLLLIAAATIAIGMNEAKAGFPLPPGLPLPGSPNVEVNINGRVPAPPRVNVQINGYLPAPPGVEVYVDSGRPYYVERERRVYIEKERPVKHHKKHRRHEDNRR